MLSPKSFRFRNFKVYGEVRSFAADLKKLSREQFPTEERFSLTTQLWRALDSIILNIAEGSDRGTDKDFAHFLNNSHTSLNEVVACLDVALDSQYISTRDHEFFLERAELLADQLTAFRKVLLKAPTK